MAFYQPPLGTAVPTVSLIAPVASLIVRSDRYRTASYYMAALLQFDVSRRGKKMLSYFRDKNKGAYRSGEEGGGLAM